MGLYGFRSCRKVGGFRTLNMLSISLDGSYTLIDLVGFFKSSIIPVKTKRIVKMSQNHRFDRPHSGFLFAPSLGQMAKELLFLDRATRAQIDADLVTIIERSQPSHGSTFSSTDINASVFALMQKSLLPKGPTINLALAIRKIINPKIKVLDTRNFSENKNEIANLELCAGRYNRNNRANEDSTFYACYSSGASQFSVDLAKFYGLNCSTLTRNP